MPAPSVRRVLAPLVLAGAVAGCGAMPEAQRGARGAVCHVLLTDEHPWHTAPALTASGVVFVSLMILALPFALLDSGQSIHSGVGPMVIGTAAVPGFVVGSVFYVALYPLERVFPLPQRTDEPVEVPEDLRGPRGPAPGPAADPSRP